MRTTNYLAHTSPDGRTQTVSDHLEGTALRCRDFAAKFGEADRGQFLGNAHDIGKCSDAFQKRLAGGPPVDHATAGAIECARVNENEMACCVIGHHGGLPDFGNPKSDPPGAPTCVGRIRKGLAHSIPPYDWTETLPAPGPKPPISDGFSLFQWTKMLYSCLVDADYLDTEAFVSDSTVQRGLYDDLPTLLDRLNVYIHPWFPGKTDLNRRRCAILSRCLEMAGQPRGVYSLTVPTGGGKTVSSLAFGLKHAVENGMDRVIYVVPYTSIIEQNAAVFRKILGAKNVVEHHSGVDYDGAEEETSPENAALRLATENWDAPVIVTTAVQFFESFYANRSSKCRKLHNVANSVVIFDEAQMIPIQQLLPCVGVMASLASQFRSTVLLCTATQPVLCDLFRRFYPTLQIQELCPNLQENFQEFRRVTYRNGAVLSDEALASALCGQGQALCIVNTRKAAQDLYALLPEDGRFHLSTRMYPAHRKAVLDTIRRRLKDGLPCRVISTSLIEAGVDIDFPAVWREIAGLDSIAQAAGRCNREGTRTAEDSIVTYFQSAHPVPLLQKINIRAAQEALQDNADPGDPETMTRYFQSLRSLMAENIDKAHILKTIREQLLPFETVADRFHLIDQATRTIYIPIGEGQAACAPLQDGTATRADYRKAGQYSVAVYEDQFRAMAEVMDIRILKNGDGILDNLELYHPETGLCVKSQAGKEFFV